MPTATTSSAASTKAGPLHDVGGPAVHPIHIAVAGRSRFKIAGLQHNEEMKVFLISGLAAAPEVLSSSASLLTGNILVLHEPGIPSPQIAASIAELVTAYRQGEASRPAARLAGGELESGREDQRRARASGASQNRKVRKLVVQAASQQEKPWHQMESEEVASFFESSTMEGRTEDLLPRYLKKYGPSLLPESVPRSSFSILFDQFKSLPVVLLNISALLSVATGGLADAAAILTVVGINAAIGYFTESQAETTIHSLKRLVLPKTVVIRGSKRQEINVDQVVPGDLLVLRPGSYVAADSRIVAAQHLTIDESALTGESLPVNKSPEALPASELALADRVNMAYLGTLVTGGQGIAIAVGTGRYTEIGKVQEMAGEAKAPETPMQKQLNLLGTKMVMASGAICGGMFLIGLARGYGLLQMVRRSVSLAVAAIPEGLPAVATTTLALGIREMRRHKVLIRHLDAVETLGCVQTICLDKTGTLTFNRMSVVAVAEGGLELEMNALLAGPLSLSIERLIQVGVLCNESVLEKEDGGHRLRGSSTENALLELTLAAGADVQALRNRFPLQVVTHRSENRNYMISLHAIQNQHDLQLLIDEQLATEKPVAGGEWAQVRASSQGMATQRVPHQEKTVDSCTWWRSRGAPWKCSPCVTGSFATACARGSPTRSG